MKNYFENSGYEEVIYQTNSKKHKHSINWEGNYNGKIANLKLKLNKDGKKENYDFKLNKEELENIFTYPINNIPLEQRLINDYNLSSTLIPTSIPRTRPILTQTSIENQNQNPLLLNLINSKSNKTKSNKTKSNKTKSNKTKSNKTKSNKTKTNKTKSNKTKSNKTKSNKTKSNKIKYKI